MTPKAKPALRSSPRPARSLPDGAGSGQADFDIPLPEAPELDQLWDSSRFNGENTGQGKGVLAHRGLSGQISRIALEWSCAWFSQGEFPKSGK